MGSQKVKTKSQETATTTPNLNPAAAGAVNGYFGNISNLLASGQPLGAPANDLQTSLNSAGMNMVGQTGAGTLLPATNGIQNAMGMLGNVQPAGLSTASAPGAYTPAQATAGQASAPGAYTPVSATAQSAALPSAYTPAQASVGQYGQVAQAQLPGLPGVAQADVSGIAGGITGGGYQGARAIDYMDAYRNPYQQQVIDASIADLNNSQGADRAAYARRAGMMGAFGGSRYGLGETNLIDSQNRTRNSAISGLLSQGWRDTLEAGQGDASNANSAGIASMQSATQASIARANLLAEAERGNVDAINEMARLGYTTGAETSRFNTGLLADAQGRQFDAANTVGMFNTGQANDAARQIYSTTADNAQFNAGQANNVNLANAGFANDAARTNFTTQADLNQFNTGQANQASQFNAGQANQALGQQYSTLADLNQFNAGAANQNAQFNSNLALNTAGTAGDMSAQLGGLLAQGSGLDMQRMGMLGDLASQQRAIELANSPYGQALMQAGLLNGDGLLALTTGQTGTTNGTSTQKKSGGFAGDLLLTIMGNASKAASMGGG